MYGLVYFHGVQLTQEGIQNINGALFLYMTENSFAPMLDLVAVSGWHIICGALIGRRFCLIGFSKGSRTISKGIFGVHVPVAHLLPCSSARMGKGYLLSRIPKVDNALQ